MIVEVIRLIGVDLVDQCLGVNTLFDRIRHILASEDSHSLYDRIILFDGAVKRIGSGHGFAGDRIETAVSHGAKPVGNNPGIFSGRDQNAQRPSGGTGCRRNVPVFILLRILCSFLIHPFTQLIFCQKRELVEVFRTVIIIRCCAGLFKTGTIKRNLIGGFHQFVDPFLLNLQNPVTVFAVHRLLFDPGICAQ